MTTTESTTRSGKPALKITCTCSTHPDGKGSAVVVGRTSFPKGSIHGTVLMANHPANVIRIGAERKGIYPA
jgi:hypothetical protein